MVAQNTPAPIDRTANTPVTGQNPGPRLTDFGFTDCAKNYLTKRTAAGVAVPFLHRNPRQLSMLSK